MASEIILDNIRNVLSVADDDEYFSLAILDGINTAAATLEQLGIGPDGGFFIDETTPWSALIGDNPRYRPVKSYITLRCRLLFDPPTLSFHISMMEDQRKELEWRLSVIREDAQWLPPTPPVFDPDDPVSVITGGDADDLPDWGD